MTKKRVGVVLAAALAVAFATWSVTAQAWSNAIVVCTRGNPEWPVKANDSYWDDAELKLAEFATPEPEPEPGDYPTLTEIRAIVREELDKTRLGS